MVSILLLIVLNYSHSALQGETGSNADETFHYTVHYE